MKKEKQVCWRGFDVICVCPLIDYGQQPIKMHTEVTYILKYFTFTKIFVFVNQTEDECRWELKVSIAFDEHLHQLSSILIKLQSKFWLGKTWDLMTVTNSHTKNLGYQLSAALVIILWSELETVKGISLLLLRRINTSTYANKKRHLPTGFESKK